MTFTLTLHGRPFAGTASGATTAHHDNVGRLAARYRALERTTQAENAWTKRGEQPRLPLPHATASTVVGRSKETLRVRTGGSSEFRGPLRYVDHGACPPSRIPYGS